MSLNSDDSRIQKLIHYHYQRNKHLSPVFDNDDLYQETWIRLNDTSESAPGAPDGMPGADYVGQAVGRAVERVFGKLRKRSQRRSAGEVQLVCDPAACLPDTDLILDLRKQINDLPSDERLVIEMLRSGYEGAEIAKCLHVSRQSVTRRKQKALRRLREVLGEEAR
jgi:DNA-directed RNA polymerase specialized sigma24 family protein